MKIPSHFSRLLLGLAIALAAATPALPQGGRRDFLTITASPGLVNFNLKPNGISAGSFPVTVTSTWQVRRGFGRLSLYAYFSNPPRALASATGGSIPSSHVFGRIGGGPFSAFTGTSIFSGGGSLTVFSTRIRGTRRSTRTDILSLQIDTTGLNLGPGVYTGVLRLQAQAI